MGGFYIGPILAAQRRLIAALEEGRAAVLLETKERVKRYVATSSRFSRQVGSPRLARAVRSRLGKERVAFWIQGVVPRALEFGARAHWIPTSKSRIRLKIGNRVITGPVWHPGNPAFRFLGQAVDEVGQSYFAQRMRQVAAEAAARF